MDEQLVSSQAPQPLSQPPPQKPKMKLWKKKLLGVVIFLVLAAAVVYNIPRILSLCCGQDSFAAGSNEMSLGKVDILDEENGFFDLNSITDEMIYSPGGYENFDLDYVKDPVDWDSGLVEDVLAKNQRALALFDSAVAKPYIQLPELANPDAIDVDNPEFYPLNLWRAASRLSLIKALQLSREGKAEQALDEAIKSVELGYKVHQSQNSTIAYLVGLSIKRQGYETIRKILPWTNLSGDDYVYLINRLKPFDENQKGLETALKGEFLLTSLNIDSIVEDINARFPLDEKGGLDDAEKQMLALNKNLYYFKPNQTKSLFAQLYGDMILESRSSCGFGNITKALAAPRTIKLYITENVIGKLLYDTVAVVLEGLPEKKCEDSLLHQVVIADLAIRAYKEDNRVLPASLNVLVPQYMQSLPIDPFDKQVLRYEPQKQILYSVGLNKQDLGGGTGPDWAKMENPTFQISFQ